MFGLLFIILILTLSHRIMYVLAVNLSIIAFITHAHRHNVNLHPRDRYLVEATRGHGCENLVQLCQHMYCQNNLGDQKCCSVQRGKIVLKSFRNNRKLVRFPEQRGSGCLAFFSNSLLYCCLKYLQLIIFHTFSTAFITFPNLVAVMQPFLCSNRSAF